MIIVIYLDNAATTGRKPQTVINAVSTALKNGNANPGRSGHSLSMRTAARVYSVRNELADFFGASGAENVVFTLNCTHGINCVIKGLVRAGDKVVISSLEHNAVTRPLYKIGAATQTAEVSLTDDNITVSNFERLISYDTRLVICTGASNVLAKVLPTAKIGAICRAKGVPFAVDAAQSTGVLPIDMKKQNIDYLCIAPHKGLYAPMGVGVLICEGPIENTIIEGGTGTASADPAQPNFLPEKLESGTINVPGIIGTGAGLEFVRRIGTEKIYKHENELCSHLYHGLKSLSSVRLYTPEPKLGETVPIVTFNFNGKTSSETANYLNDKGIAVRAGLHCAPSAHRMMGTLESGAVRVAPSVFNGFHEIQSLINALKAFR